MKRAIREHAVTFTAIVGIVALAMGVVTYVLREQGARLPFISDTPVRFYAELSSAQAVTAGQGQSVQVSGVRVGTIAGTELRAGIARVLLDLEPEYADLLHTDATALLRPRTGLKDMLLEVQPGSHAAPVARPGFTIPVANTAPDVGVDEVLAKLDADTRAYLQLLIGGAARGTRGQGDALRDLFRRFEPTHRDLARVTGSLATRRSELRRVVRSLRVLSEELAGRDDDLAQLVASSARTLRAFAAEDGRLGDAVHRLPGAMAATREALAAVQGFAGELGPTARALRPVLRRLEPASAALVPLARTATPLLRRDVRPLVREARPLAREVRAPSVALRDGAEPTRRSGVVLNHLLNMLAFNPDGRESPDDPDRQEGMLFWLAWANHLGSLLHATGDAHGPLRQLVLSAPCTSLAGYLDVIGQGDPLLGAVLGGLEGAVTDPRVCGDGSALPARTRARLRGGKLERPKALRAKGARR